MSVDENLDFLDGVLKDDKEPEKDLVSSEIQETSGQTEGTSEEKNSQSETSTKKKVKILPPKEKPAQKKKTKPNAKQQKSPDFSVQDCVARSKKLFKVPSEVAKIALKHQGYNDTDMITLDKAKRIVSNFLKKEVK